MTITTQEATKIALDHGLGLSDVEALAKLAASPAHAREIATQFVNNNPAEIRERQFAEKLQQLRQLTTAANGNGFVNPTVAAAIMGADAPTVVDADQAAADLVAAAEADRERSAAVEQAIVDGRGQTRRPDGVAIAPTSGISEVTTRRARRR